jgi:hypothetical protein
LRQENFSNDTSTTTASANVGRSRQRFRLRIAAELPLHDKLKAKLRLASGTGEQVSTNQSFDNLSSQKELWIDTAFLEYMPWSFLKVQGGRMSNPLWTIYSSDIVWDGDFNPEGFGASAQKLAGPVNVFANAMYMVVDEDSTNSQGTDQYEVSSQLGAEFRLPLESRIKLAFAQHQWVNERSGTFSQATTNNGNRRSAAGVLLNEFRVNEITGQLSFWVVRIPVALQGTLINNVDARDFAAPQDAKKDKGSQLGVIIGKAGAAKSWEVAYFQKVSEFDATVADVADSDFGNGGTGREGSIMWASFAPTDYTVLTVKRFDVELEDSNFPLTAGITKHDIGRLQIDFSVKF